ncbi:hypothetical protein AGOR_G00234640 [Albula goreensis]|uniref:Uncharacterized protein n=1 Tax=Albula goreensis TaxID=1534307 RepID=A0A8T3CMF0_9TELE|nr:hypothetical protein AGOR_G00234640 [Albula goreensis]
MYLCRSAWQKLGPLARKTATHFARNVGPKRTMSSGFPSGDSGQNIFFVILCGGSLAASLTYAVGTVKSNQERYSERIEQLKARPKKEWEPKPWPPKGSDEDEE